MCGIAGYQGARPPADTRLELALEVLGHRGPDGQGVFRDNQASLGHTRLSILDLSEAGRQPMRDESSGAVIVYNGEIYNYRELRAGMPGTLWRSTSDTEVILQLYLRDGINCVQQLRGMFAFAIWDPRSQTLHLARDRFGIKPLYYFCDDQGLTFASEIKAILALTGLTPRFNLPVLYDYLQTGKLAHSSETLFAGVSSLSAGTVLSFENGRLITNVYWSPESIAPQEVSPGRDLEAELWDLLRESVDLHLVSDVPVGISLSSGLDSQLILHLLAASGRKPYHTFTFGFDDPNYDEIIRVRGVQFPLPLQQHYLRTSPEDTLVSLQRAVRFFEAPLGGLGTLSAYRLMQIARDNGIKVLLCGEGADELFGGYKYYYYAYFRDLFETGQLALLEAELEAYGRTNGEWLRPGTPEFSRRILQSSDTVQAPDGTSLGQLGFVGPALREVAATGSQTLSPGLSRVSGHLHEAMLRDLTYLKVPKLLWFQDRAAMAWGVETRVPFLDHRLFEFVYRLPGSWFIRNGVSKFVPKRLLQRFAGVSGDVAVKHYVATPQREWLKGPLVNAIVSFMDDGWLAQSGLIDYPRWKDAYLRYAAAPELGNSFFVWKMINLEAMARVFFGSQRSPI